MRLLLPPLGTIQPQYATRVACTRPKPQPWISRRPSASVAPRPHLEYAFEGKVVTEGVSDGEERSRALAVHGAHSNGVYVRSRQIHSQSVRPECIQRTGGSRSHLRWVPLSSCDSPDPGVQESLEALHDFTPFGSLREGYVQTVVRQKLNKQKRSGRCVMVQGKRKSILRGGRACRQGTSRLAPAADDVHGPNVYN